MGGGDKMATGSSAAAAAGAAPAVVSEELRRGCRFRRPVGVPDRPWMRCPIITAPAVGDDSVTIFCKYKAWASSAISTAVKLHVYREKRNDINCRWWVVRMGIGLVLVRGRTW